MTEVGFWLDRKCTASFPSRPSRTFPRKRPWRRRRDEEARTPRSPPEGEPYDSNRKERRTKTRPIQREDDVAIRQLVQDMQDAQNTKNGELFASAFAREHDYIAINGMFLPNQSRQDNARIHQRLYDESRSSVVGEYGKVEVRLKVAKVRLLTPMVAVVHARSEFR